MTDDTSVLPPFSVTRAAVDRIASLGGAVRVDVADGGCCGTTWRYERVDAGCTDEYVERGDLRFGCPGAWLLVSADAAAVLPGSRLDYGERLRPPRFRVTHNPNTPDTCACRRSFGRPWPGPGQIGCVSYRPMPWDEAQG